MIIDTKKLKSQLSSNIVTRFAPSPTGLLHLGHIASAIYVWGVAQAVGGKVKIRLEDHDRQRSKSKYCKAILEDLKWLGFIDHPNTEENTIKIQSNRSSIYKKHLKNLEKQDLIYRCTCSRKKIQLENLSKHEELFYSGTCRNLNHPEESSHSLRYKVFQKKAYFFDHLNKKQIQEPHTQCGDFVIKDRKDNWSYHFCVVVDDFEENINLVIRGSDLQSSTGRQILLFDDLCPSKTKFIRYLHHPLILDPLTSIKLSKQNKSEPIANLRAKGFSASRILGEAAYYMELNPQNKDIKVSNLAKLIEGDFLS